MTTFRIFGLAAIASTAMAANDRDGALPPVLRPSEPVESVVFRLPGLPTPPAKPAAFRQLPVSVPVPIASPLPGKLNFAPLPTLPAVAALVQPTAIPSTVPKEREIAFFCQKRIGLWTADDARKEFGAPLRSRVALDEARRPSGTIYAYKDPTGRYREIELDFNDKTGTLRSVFGYPPQLSWDQAQKRWPGEVMAADAPQGRKFYSYANRRLDVLVDREGRVISLGLY